MSPPQKYRFRNFTSTIDEIYEVQLFKMTAVCFFFSFSHFILFFLRAALLPAFEKENRFIEVQPEITQRSHTRMLLTFVCDAVRLQTNCIKTQTILDVLAPQLPNKSSDRSIFEIKKKKKCQNIRSSSRVVEELCFLNPNGPPPHISDIKSVQRHVTDQTTAH